MHDESTHFQTLLCTFKYQGDFFLVFPWAEGNLHDLWGAIPNPKPTDILLSWALTQMGNIAHGLAKVSLLAPGEVHGGLGPNRIIFFQDLQAQDVSEETSQIIATNLVIAYPGKKDVDHENANQNELLWLTYDAPDYRRGRIMSSKADVWSLGCTYLEFVSWLSLGFDAVKEFSEWRGLDDDSPEFETDHFYTTDLQEIRPSVFEWTERLKSNPECPKPLIAVIDFVMTEMLLLEPSIRSSAERVSDWFTELHRQTFENVLQVHPTSERSFLTTSRERYLIKKVLGQWNGVIRMRQEARRR
ncbi:uncharacterized protein LDX57_002587 [Aspergillus melleus]|uniref:uncharacterized protein n=1 Tax=Aspergillus melleus TaxID=138277 RepID=UPI001E8E3A29|nr:uncharacterized protein LDX57_002587 [Aspergillus melleus]KAH8424844.1 hypothetical protein LDX57_002587 [Aspergillus melleus]